MNNLSIEIEFLNHASVVISCGDIKILCDPWFEGTCFKEGWGLIYDNPNALGNAAKCSHLWISHFHSDHLHIPTLKKLAEVAPNINVLANESANFSMSQVLQSLGFHNIYSFLERKPLKLSDEVEITRFPVTGIDNFLLIKIGDIKILNYNDCNLPKTSLSLLMQKFGSIDVFLNKFNHANKLLDVQDISNTNDIKENLIERFIEVIEIVKPKYVLPFASMHYYRSQYSINQNKSLLSIEELADSAPQIIQWNVGDKILFNKDNNINLIEGRRFKNKLTIREYKKSYCLTDIINAGNNFQSKVKVAFYNLTFLFKPLYIFIEDLDATISFDIGRGVKVSELASQTVHIKAHSQAIMEWFEKPYGTDSFLVGAHFDLVSSQISPLQRVLLASLLMENKIDLYNLINMVLNGSAFSFLYNRREEILGVIFGMKLKTGKRW